VRRVFLISILVLVYSVVYAAPAMWGLALNHETKECGGFWAGDEYVRFYLPEGWEVYYPDIDKGIIETEIGTCNYTTPNSMEECCNQLGYTFVGENVGEGHTTPLGWKRMFFPLIVVALVISSSIIILFFVIRFILKRPKGKRRR